MTTFSPKADLPLRNKLQLKNGIFVEPDLELQGVTSQFLEEGAVFARKRKASRSGHAALLINQALSRISLGAKPKRVLDLGCGAGLATFPLLDILPECTVTATDISMTLLEILKEEATPEQLNRCNLVCADSLKLDFFEDAFDLVVGMSILHHLFDPEALLRRLHMSIRPGGTAVFFEPFASGCAFFQSACLELVERSRELGIATACLKLLEAQAFDSEVRMSLEPNDARLAVLDDKWLFTKKQVLEIAERIGYRSAQCYATAPLGWVESYMRSLLAYAEVGDLPPKAWDVLKRYDRCLPALLHDDIFISGLMVFQR